MKDLIEALTIMLKHGDVYSPSYCSHDLLTVCPNIPAKEFSPEDIARLDELSFFIDEEDGSSFQSFRFGSC